MKTTIGKHRIPAADNEPTVPIVLQMPYAAVLAGSLDAGRHRRGGCLDIVEGAAAVGLILFGLLLISTGVWWW